MSACTRAMLQTLIRLAHQTKRHMPFAFGIMKLAVPRPVRTGLYRRYFEREINQNATVQTIFENIYNRNCGRVAKVGAAPAQGLLKLMS